MSVCTGREVELSFHIEWQFFMDRRKRTLVLNQTKLTDGFP